jgi:Transposase zinc-binding domain/Putative transposase
VELADVVRAHAGELTGLSVAQQHVLRAIADCRTAALGGHRRECAQCGHQEIAYNSGRDPRCPKCQGLEAARWIDAQQQDLLPVPYFHVVFTVPAELHDLCLAAPRVTYTLLFAAVAETLAQVALRRLGIKIALTAVLHTWTQLLLFHPHLHCIVPAGGLDPGHTHWIAARPDFFLPVRVLAEVFRGKLLSKLETAIDRARIPRCRDEDPHDVIKRAAVKCWVVYCKPAFASRQYVRPGHALGAATREKALFIMSACPTPDARPPSAQAAWSPPVTRRSCRLRSPQRSARGDREQSARS